MEFVKLAIWSLLFASPAWAGEHLAAAMVESDGRATVVNLSRIDKGHVKLELDTGAAVYFEPPLYKAGWVFSVGECEVEGLSDKSVVAISKPEHDKEWHSQVLYAWKVEAALNRLVSIPTIGISCRNESYGD